MVETDEPATVEYEATETESVDVEEVAAGQSEATQGNESENEPTRTDRSVDPDELFLSTLERAFPGVDIRGNKEQLIMQGHGFCGLIDMTGSVENLYQSRGDILTGELAEIDDEVFELVLRASIESYCPKFR